MFHLTRHTRVATGGGLRARAALRRSRRGTDVSRTRGRRGGDERAPLVGQMTANERAVRFPLISLRRKALSKVHARQSFPGRQSRRVGNAGAFPGRRRFRRPPKDAFPRRPDKCSSSEIAFPRMLGNPKATKPPSWEALQVSTPRSCLPRKLSSRAAQRVVVPSGARGGRRGRRHGRAEHPENASMTIVLPRNHSGAQNRNPRSGAGDFLSLCLSLFQSGRADLTAAITEGACSCAIHTKTAVFESPSPTEGDSRQPEITPRWVTGGKRVRRLLCLLGEPAATPRRGDPGPQARSVAPGAG
jgi:hypothetical protein